MTQGCTWKRGARKRLWSVLGGNGKWKTPSWASHCRGRPVCFFVCMRFNITIVLCFAPSLCLRSCRTERASATSSPSDPPARSRGHEPSSPRRAWRGTCSATTPSRPSRRSTWKWGRTTTEGRGPSAPSSRSSQRKKVTVPTWRAESDAQIRPSLSLYSHDFKP